MKAERAVSGNGASNAKQIVICLGLFFQLLLAGSAQAQLTRSQAVAALLDPGSGVAIDPTNSTVWSPFVDFGFGAGREGLLADGAFINPHALGWPPYPG